MIKNKKNQKLNICIFGYGSMGQRYTQILYKNYENINLVVVSKKKHNLKKSINLILFKNYISQIKNYKFDAIFICTPANTHLEIAEKMIANGVKNIFIEKPISNNFEKSKKFYDEFKRKKINLFIGYLFKFDDVAKKFKFYTDKKIFGKIYSINCYCGSYLPKWRKKITNTSIKKASGGGVLLELSHEIHYLIWFFKSFKIVGSYLRNSKFIKKINVEDSANLIFKKNNFYINLHLNFHQKFNERYILINGSKCSLKWDLANRSIIKYENNEKIIFNSKSSFENTYIKQLEFFLKNLNNFDINKKNFQESLKVMKFIEDIKNSNER